MLLPSNVTRAKGNGSPSLPEIMIFWFSGFVKNQKEIKFTSPLYQRTMWSISIGCIAGHSYSFSQFCHVNWFWFQSELRRSLNNHLYQWRGTVSSQIIVRCAWISSIVWFVNSAEEQAAVPFVEHSLKEISSVRGIQSDTEGIIIKQWAFKFRQRQHTVGVCNIFVTFILLRDIPERCMDHTKIHLFPSVNSLRADLIWNGNLKWLVDHTVNKLLVVRK